MSKKRKHFIEKPLIFVERQYQMAKRRYVINRLLFVYFNILSMVATFFILTIGTLVLAKILWSYSSPNYFYATTFVTAIITLATSLINFFYIKDNIKKYKDQKEFIRNEIIKYEINAEVYKKSKDKEFEIFHRVTNYIGYFSAKEVNDERA
ncbi:MAG: DUF4231 domain-containing protein [Mycoplasmatales bacterium]|nr:DUF4231 domain-containing protein [Mycoplasmatales bacterium]